MFGVPLSLVLSFTIFSTFLFYQQKHAANFSGATIVFGEILTIWAGLAFLFELGFLVYFGYRVSTWSAIKLFALSMALWIPLTMVEVIVTAKLPLLPFALSLAGFLVLPLCGYMMFLALP